METYLHAAEPLVPECSYFEVEIAIEKLKICKLPGIKQIPAKLIKIGCNALYFVIHKLINSIWSKEEL
jgi:hypothetical protein